MKFADFGKVILKLVDVLVCQLSTNYYIQLWPFGLYDYSQRPQPQRDRSSYLNIFGKV